MRNQKSLEQTLPTQQALYPKVRHSIVCVNQVTKAICSMICAGVTLSVGAMAEWLCSGLQIRVARFDSGLRLQ